MWPPGALLKRLGVKPEIAEAIWVGVLVGAGYYLFTRRLRGDAIISGLRVEEIARALGARTFILRF